MVSTVPGAFYFGTANNVLFGFCTAGGLTSGQARFYNGYMVNPDSIAAATGRGVLIGGNRQAPQETPYAAIEVTEAWTHGIRFETADISGGDAITMEPTQKLAWTDGTVAPKVKTTTKTYDFSSIAVNGSQNFTVTVAGATSGDVVMLGLPASNLAGSTFTGFVQSANIVTVRCNNVSGASIDPPSGVYRITVVKAQ